MRKFLFSISVGLAFVFQSSLLGDVSSDFIRARRLISKADNYQKSGDNTSARECYSRALEKLEAIRQTAPDWDPDPVEDQINYCTEHITKNKTVASVSAVEVKAPAPQLKDIRSEETQPSRPVPDRGPEEISRQDLSKTRSQIEALEKEKEALQSQIKELKAVVESANQQQQAFIEESKNLKERLAQTDRIRAQAEKAQSEYDALRNTQEEQKKASESNNQRINALSEENKALQEKLKKIEMLPENLAALQKENEDLRNGNRELKASSEAGSHRLQVLSEENQTFKEELNKMDKLRARVRELEKENESLRSVSEAVKAASSKGGAPSDLDPDLQARNAKLASEAKRLYAKQDLDGAAGKYERILRDEPENVTALSNLGVIRLRQNKLTEAEKNLRAALAVDPQDAFSLSVLGIAYYRHAKYDSAVSTLTRATTIHPKNYEAHNYLGIAYRQKGYREAAEKELLKAIQLKSDYADAYFNLAVLYARQNPPSLVPARKNYKQARSLGMPANAELEKILK